jgi:long-chain acyl-CoA synthetase
MSTLSAALRRSARLHAHRPAMLQAEGPLDWHGFADRVARLADLLAAAGVQRGQRFGVLAANSVDQATLFQAGYWLGATPVPVNTRLAPAEIADLLDAADCRWVAVDAAQCTLLDHPALQRWLPGHLVLGDAALQAALQAASPRAPTEVAAGDEALLLHTGGTAGRPKCVVLSHAQVLANALQMAFIWPAREDDVALHVAPMFHSADLVMTGLMLAGAAHAYLPRFTPGELLCAIERHRVTTMMVVPTILVMLLESGLLPQHDLRSLRRILYGGAPLARSWVGRAVAAFDGVQFFQGYGLTETGPILTVLDHAAHLRALADPDPRRPMPCGAPLPGVQLRTAGTDEQALADGEVGEVQARGPAVFDHYLGLPEHSAEVLRGGWFHTGDIGRTDASGQLTILDRRKDLVIVNGEKVYSVEVEAVLLDHPAVAEVAVIAVPSRQQGEAVFAVVVCKPGASVTRRQLRDFCKGRIGAFKIPTGFAFVPALPRSALGKVLKESLRHTHGAPLSPPPTP